MKDFGREAGSVSYADIDRDRPGEGYALVYIRKWCIALTCLPSILEYLSREDSERAVKELDGKDLRGNSVRVSLDTEVGIALVNVAVC